MLDDQKEIICDSIRVHSLKINADLRSNYGFFADSDVPLIASGFFQTKAASRFVKVRLAIEKQFLGFLLSATTRIYLLIKMRDLDSK